MRTCQVYAEVKRDDIHLNINRRLYLRRLVVGANIRKIIECFARQRISRESEHQPGSSGLKPITASTNFPTFAVLHICHAIFLP